MRTARHSAGSVERYESGGKDDNDSALGLSAGGSLTPPKARVLLKFLLREARTPAEVQAAINAS